jgi:uncharacterized membrane protein YeaQ/YmgE (transglycosylase-associated protein family)
MKTLLAALAALAGGWLIINLIGALIVGAIARALLPGKDKIGWFLTIAIGFLGGILGKIVAFVIGWHHMGWLRSFLVSVVGAFVLLIAHRIWRAGKSAPRAPAPGA